MQMGDFMQRLLDSNGLSRGWLQCVLFGLSVFTLVGQAAEPVPQTVDLIANPGSTPGFERRQHLLYSLNSTDLLSGADKLISFMELATPPEGMGRNTYFSLTNDIFDLLVREKIEEQRLLDHLISTIPNEEVDRVWRDYCVQKLSSALVFEAVTSESRQAGLRMLDQLTTGSMPRMQGTALIVSTDLCGYPFLEDCAFLEQSSLGQRALTCASNDEAPLIDRVTALQVAAQFNASGLEQYALGLLNPSSTEGVPVMLQVSAIAALGVVDSEASSSVILSYEKSSDIRLRKAARTALKRIAQP